MNFQRVSRLGAVLCGAVVLCCKSGGAPTDSSVVSQSTKHTSASSTGQTEAVRSEGNPAAPAVSQADPTPARLPKLKPIHRNPFPEDVPQDVLCEAINSTEADLWVRFGHLLPLYMRGAIYVLQADASKEETIKHYITDDYVRPHFPQLASCRDKALLYISNMFEEAEFAGKPFGRLHLVGELVQHLGIQTLESFWVDSDNVRRSDYCKEDGEVCDALLMLNISNEGRGLCGKENFERCRAIPKSELACRVFTNKSLTEQKECNERIWRALGIME
jgi:hypothetical protein